MQYTHGVQTTLMKSKGETEDGMKTITLTKKQVIAKMLYKRVDKITIEFQFYDQNENLIIGLPSYFPKEKDQFGRYKKDNHEFNILDGCFFIF